MSQSSQVLFQFWSFTNGQWDSSTWALTSYTQPQLNPGSLGFIRTVPDYLALLGRSFEIHRFPYSTQLWTKGSLPLWRRDPLHLWPSHSECLSSPVHSVCCWCCQKGAQDPETKQTRYISCQNVMHDMISIYKMCTFIPLKRHKTQRPVLISRNVCEQKGKMVVFSLTGAKQSTSLWRSPARLIAVIDLCLQHKGDGRLPDTTSLAARSNWSAM